jgi:hypothetical protein
VKNLKPASMTTRRACTVLLLASVPGCAREVDVDDGAGGTSNTSSGPGGTGAASHGGRDTAGAGGRRGSSLIDGIEQADASSAGGAGPSGSGGSANGDAGASTSDAGGARADSGAAVPIRDIEVLDETLDFLSVPSVGSDMISLLQYTSDGVAVTRHVDWNASADSWYEAAGAYHIYTAASGAHQLSLLYAGATYGIYADGGTAELSGNPSTYKEFLAVNQDGFAWVDYESSSSLGRIVFQPWSGSRRNLTDNLLYRAQIDLSDDQLVYVEYASTAPNAIGQVMVQSLAGGAAVPVAASSHHQDHPAVDGDWVVWEEYLSSADSVIRAHHIPDGETNDVSARTGFRLNADVVAGRAVWEDQRSGDGNIYFVSLTDRTGEQIAVSGGGHSTAPRLTSDGLIWLETDATIVGLVHAHWTP